MGVFVGAQLAVCKTRFYIPYLLSEGFSTLTQNTSVIKISGNTKPQERMSFLVSCVKFWQKNIRTVQEGEASFCLNLSNSTFFMRYLVLNLFPNIGVLKTKSRVKSFCLYPKAQSICVKMPPWYEPDVFFVFSGKFKSWLHFWLYFWLHICVKYWRK